jgi:hypothetical protein
VATYFYDEQIKRFLIQFARLISNWEVSAGVDNNNNPIIKRVPVMYGDASRQAATILNNNSANNLPSTPLLTYYVSGLEYDQKRTQEPYFVDKTNIRQRAYNPDTNDWESVQGTAYTVERLMPVPYTLRITVDFWSSNYKQKFELIEQLGVLFNPSIELQSTDNFIDWTSLSVVYQDGLNFTSRSIPAGTSNDIDVLTWKFYMPIWLSGPVKVKKFGVINRIIASIFKGKYREDIQDDDLLLGTRQKITPYGYKLLLMDNMLQLLPANHAMNPRNSLDNVDPQQTDLSWKATLNSYGVVKEGISMISLENPYMDTPIMGTIAFNPLDDRFLLFNIDTDTLPSNTLNPVNSVIDPTVKTPGNNLLIASINQRYLIVDDIPPQIEGIGPWVGLTSGANANDVIQFDGEVWTVVFNSNEATNPEFLTNLTTNIQYRFTLEEGWMKSYEGWYEQGNWRIII